MAYTDQKMSGGKITAIVIVAMIHLALGYAFVTGLALNYVKKAQEKLNTFDVAPPPPPPPDVPPPPPPPDQKFTPAAGRDTPADRSDQRAVSGGHPVGTDPAAGLCADADRGPAGTGTRPARAACFAGRRPKGQSRASSSGTTPIRLPPSGRKRRDAWSRSFRSGPTAA